MLSETQNINIQWFLFVSYHQMMYKNRYFVTTYCVLCNSYLHSQVSSLYQSVVRALRCS